MSQHVIRTTILGGGGEGIATDKPRKTFTYLLPALVKAEPLQYLVIIRYLELVAEQHDEKTKRDNSARQEWDDWVACAHMCPILPKPSTTGKFACLFVNAEPTLVNNCCIAKTILSPEIKKDVLPVLGHLALD